MTKAEIELRGNGVSPGVALGQAVKFDSQSRAILRYFIPEHRIAGEMERLEKAIEASKLQLERLKSRIEQEIGYEPSHILDAHLLMLEDRSLTTEMSRLIRGEQANAEWAVRRVADRIRRAYLSLGDEYFRERVKDFESVLERIIQNLSGAPQPQWGHLPGELIVVARDFNPSLFATLDLERIRGLALAGGGRTSHTAILARGLAIPTVMEIRNLLAEVTTGDLLLLDGYEGRIFAHPTPETLAALRPRLEEYRIMAAPPAQAGAATTTKDGIRITLKANTELPMEVRLAQRCAAEGIGLFRSELLFLSSPGAPPSISDQAETYTMLAREMSPSPVAIRTLDIGSGQSCAGIESTGQQNPSMGLRGIRLGLVKEEMFAGQIEAILRASGAGNVEIVLPMVASIEEVWQARSVISRLRRQLASSIGEPVAEVPVGVMIEVPAAVIALDSLARAADFLCVGTNDLIQYLLAVDRDNPQVAHLFQPLHPAVLHSLQRIASVSASLNRPVRVCGEMSANPFFAILLIGMGFTELSMNSISIPVIRRVLGGITMEAAASIVKDIMGLQTAAEAADLLIRQVSGLGPADLAPYIREVTGMNSRQAGMAAAPAGAG